MGKHPYDCLLVVLIGSLFAVGQCSSRKPNGVPAMAELRLEPTEAVVTSGSSVTFICSYPRNTSFEWTVNGHRQSMRTTRGVSVNNDTEEGSYFWSRMTLMSVKRESTGEVMCVAGDAIQSATSFLVVNGVSMNGPCTQTDDCVTDKAICRNSLCQCPRNEVLLKLTKSGYEVCRQMIYRLHDPCEFSEQCSHLVDSKSICAPTGLCVCDSQTVEYEGRCVANGFTAATKDQELYKVGLIAVTCFILAIVALTLWITLKNSCKDDHHPQRTANSHQADSRRSTEVIMEISGDKPPSYDEVHESADDVLAPPNFKDALKNSMTAKRLLRQVSAPAGQLLSRAISFKKN